MSPRSLRRPAVPGFRPAAAARHGRRLARVVAGWLFATQISCQPAPGFAQTCGAAGGDNRPAATRPCDGDTASHPADGPASATANSIDLVTGNKYLRERDAAWPDGLVLDRHYNSLNPLPRTLGTGWTHGYDTVLVRIERSGPPEPAGTDRPTQFTGGMEARAAERVARSRRDPAAGRDARAVESGASTVDGIEPAAAAHGRQGGRHRRAGQVVELQIIQADGRRLVFRAVREPGTPRGMVRYRSVSGDYGAVSEQPGASADRYQWRWRDGRRIVFDADGRMRRIEPLEGPPLALDYRPDGRLSAVRASGGAALRFDYDARAGHPGSLRSVQLPDGTRVRYEHDALGLLVRATDGSGDERRYRYDDPLAPHGVTEVLDATGGVRGRFEYDAGGRATASALGTGAQAIRVRYRLPERPGDVGESIVTDARGRESRYRWRYGVHAHRTHWLSARGEGCDACPPVGLDYQHDAQGRLIAVRHATQDRTLRWRRDAHGRVLEVASASGAGGAMVLARFGYAGDDPDAPPAYVERPSVAPGRAHRLTWTRDAAGRVLAVRESGWAPAAAGLQADLRPTRFVPIERDWRIERAPDGLPSAVDGPLPGSDDRLRIDRDGAGRVMRIRRPAGLESRLERDRWGRVLAVVDQDGITRRWTRGADGRPLSLDVDGAQLRVTWGPDPLRVAFTSPDTGPLVLRFDDADRLLGVEDAHGRRLQVVRDADTLVRVELRDAAGTVLQSIEPGAGSVGPPSPAVSAPTHIQGGRREWRDAAGGVTVVLRDDFGRTVATASPQGLRTLQSWDAADRLVAAVRSDGRAVRHQYDAAGRLLESGLPGRADRVRYRWLGGRLASVSDPWQTVAWQHDRHGRVIAEATLIGPRADGIERLVSVVRTWHYDADGRLAGETLPGGHALDYRYGTDGRLRSIAFTDRDGRRQPLLDRIDWLPFGAAGRGLTGFQSASMLRTRIDHDLQGRIASVSYASSQQSADTTAAYPPAFTVHRDAQGRVDAIERDGVPEAYAYDGAGHLTGVASPALVEGYAWDAHGNRIARARRTPSGWQVERQRHGDGSALRSRETHGPDGRSQREPIQTDAAGHVKVFGGTHGPIRLLPDGHGRPLAIADAQGHASLAAYNAFGLRVVSLAAGTRDGPTLHLHRDGRPQALLDRHGALKQWQVRIGERLVAVLMFDGARVAPWFVHGDAAGRPVALSDARGVVHRLPARSPFGEPLDEAPSQATPTLRPVAFTSPGPRLPQLETRLPGGLIDGERRDYDPAAGRWLQPDPLGLAAGPNLHAFAGGNPIEHIDPSGLYQTDVHFYMTYFLARVAGLPERQALTVANAAQYVDDNPETEPIPTTLGNFFRGFSNQRDRLAAYHMMSDLQDPPRLPEESPSLYARRRVANPQSARLHELLAMSNRAAMLPEGAGGPCRHALLFGQFLHAFEDTFSHRDERNVPIPVGEQGFGHLGKGESPDFTFNHTTQQGVVWRVNLDRTMQMEREVFQYLKNGFGREANGRDGFPIEFADIESTLENFNRVEESSCADGQNCWHQKRAILSAALERLGLGRLPAYDSTLADRQRSKILGK